MADCKDGEDSNGRTAAVERNVMVAAQMASAAARTATAARAGCDCDDISLTVECSNTTLDVLPIALNMGIKHLKMNHNKIRIVDASFQFYEHLISLDLSRNLISDVEVKSFAAQHSLRRLILEGNRITSLSNQVRI